MSRKPWRGRKILIVEDEYYVATELRDKFADAGAHIIGPASSLAVAMQLISENPDIHGAVLDVNLSGEMVFPAADILIKLEVPFIFTTGYDRSALPVRFSDIRRCEKPLGFSVINQNLIELVEKARQLPFKSSS